MSKQIKATVSEEEHVLITNASNKYKVPVSSIVRTATVDLAEQMVKNAPTRGGTHVDH